MKNSDEVRYWLQEIEDSQRRDKDFLSKGKEILDIYNGEDPDKIPFNILYSNTETLAPALYSKLPRPKIKPRFSQKTNEGLTRVDLLDKAVCESSNRMISYLLDTNTKDYGSPDESFASCVLDSLLPGRGVTTIKYDAEMVGKDDDEEVEWSTICLDTRKWDRVYFGFATKWEKVPWIAYEEFIDEEEAKEMFGEKASKIKFSISDEDEQTESEYEDKKKTARLYQIWDKSEKKVIYVSDSCTEILKKDDDPLNINGFFNTPRPLTLHRRSNDLRVTALYCLYENQANELNRISRRLNRVVEAIKVRGAYNGSLGNDLERIFEVDDTELVRTENATMLAEGGFEKNIWMIPIAELVGVAQQLFLAREACKSVIYEITGISDILRGASKASETLGAQKMKEAWGTMRLKSMQKEVQMYVRDVMRIMLDIAAKNLPQKMWVQVTGLPYPTKEQKEKAVELMNKLKQQVAQMQMMQQQPDEKLQKELKELTTLLSLPTWETILDRLKNDFERSYSVDIETNSTLDANATEDRKEIAEFMNAMSQFMNGIMPMVQSKTLPFSAAKSWLLDIARRYGFGDEVVDEINAMKEPKSTSPEQIKEQQKKLMDEKKKLNEQKNKLDQEQQKFQQSQVQVGGQLDQRANQLKIDEIKFNAKKELFEAKKKLDETLAVEKLKAMDDKMELDLERREMKAEAKLGKMIDKHERSIQSVADKQIANYQKTADKIKDINVEPKSRKKIVKLIYGDDGKPVGANVEELEGDANGDIEFTYNEEGRPDGALVN